jgi:hypothetical protein
LFLHRLASNFSQTWTLVMSTIWQKIRFFSRIKFFFAKLLTFESTSRNLAATLLFVCRSVLTSTRSGKWPFLTDKSVVHRVLGFFRCKSMPRTTWSYKNFMKFEIVPFKTWNLRIKKSSRGGTTLRLIRFRNRPDSGKNSCESG